MMPPLSRHFCHTFRSAPAPEAAPQRIPFGWQAAALRRDAPLHLYWEGPPPQAATRLRITLALDQREAKEVAVELGQDGTRLGVLDIQFGYACQSFECEIPLGHAAAVAAQGLRLRMVEGRTPLWIFCGGVPEDAHALLPHFLEPAPGSWAAAYTFLASRASVQPFGWLEGCVLEGLLELGRSVPAWATRAETALADHLGLFFPQNEMVYESPRGVPMDNRLSSMEATLMLPALLRHRPDHPALGRMREFWMGAIGENGLIGGEGYQKCEVCYTVAYPLALLSRQRGDEAGVALALEQLRILERVLHHEGLLYQATYKGEYTFPYWSRGMAWYLLGFARVLEITGTDASPATRDAAAALARACQRLLPFQGADGLWPCYAHLPETGAETSGTGGIAAALLLAHRLGCAPDEARLAAERALEGLRPYLSADGLLNGVCQSNKKEAGDALQRRGFRCSSAMGLGLAVQAAALLGRS